jgi:hypothetical protein
MLALDCVFSPVQIKFLSQLSSLVVSAVKHVFAPDIRYEAVDYAEKVITSASG